MTSVNNAVFGNEAIQAAIKAGNINISNNTSVQYLELSESSRREQQLHQETVRKFETTKRARSVLVPTSIDEVKQKLRELGHPVTLFGEDHADRRERLREVIASFELDEEESKKFQKVINQTQSATNEAKSKVQKEITYSNASDALISARKIISEFSFSRAHDRILETKRTRDSEELQAIEDENAMKLYEHTKELSLNCSQVGDDRPLSIIRYSPNGNNLATGSLGTAIKIWDSKNQSCLAVGLGHEERITSIAWQPNNQDSILASSSADKTCNIWSFKTSDMVIDNPNEVLKPIRTLSGHAGVVSCCDFHPMGQYLGSSSHDYTFRLWDVETGTELLIQDGHNREVTNMSFQLDGSLVLSGDISGLVLIWDLRSGQNIQSFQGHIKKIVRSSFNINGFQAATCSVDNLVRIWDLRKKKSAYILPSHNNAITDVRYSKSGELLATSSFDGTIKVWGVRDYRLLNTLNGHLGKVMSCDYSSDERYICSAGYDRTFKIWAHKNEF